jgi:ATP-dependent Clp protease ATP-binding subunit ClpA
VRLFGGMLERFTRQARDVVVLAEEEARALQHGYLGTEHRLLGLLREEEGLAARVLEALDVTMERARARTRVSQRAFCVILMRIRKRSATR